MLITAFGVDVDSVIITIGWGKGLRHGKELCSWLPSACVVENLKILIAEVGLLPVGRTISGLGGSRGHHVEQWWPWPG